MSYYYGIDETAVGWGRIKFMDKETNEMSEKKVKGSGQTKNFEEKCELSMKNFICDEYSIGREERQYVVFLYNILRKYSTPESREKTEDQIGKVEEIFKVCGLENDAVVEKVFYEPSFMRDFFERKRRLVLTEMLDEKERKEKILQKDSSLFKKKENFPEEESFCDKLIKYVYKRKHKEVDIENIEVEYSGRECNLGQNKNWEELDKLKIYNQESNETINLDGERDWIKYRVKWMMSAQPDIAVIYSIPDKTNDKKYLLFIECKYLSGESTYTYINTENGEKESEKQRKIQWMIADFLCNYLSRNNNCQVEMKLSSGMKEEQSRLVKFVRGRKTKVITENGDMRGEIFLKDLIECDSKIYS